VVGAALMALKVAQEPITSNASARVREEITRHFWGASTP